MNGYESTFQQSYTQAIADTVNAALATLGFADAGAEAAAPAVPGPILPADPLPYDVQPDPVGAGDRVIYGGAILPFGLEPIDYDTLLAMSGELQFAAGGPGGRLLNTELVPRDAIIVNALGEIVDPAYATSPPFDVVTSPPFDVDVVTSPPFDVVTSPPFPSLPLPEDDPMSLIAGLTKFAGSSLGQQLGQALITRVTTSKGGGMLPTIATMSRPFPGGPLPALPGQGFTTGPGFGTTATGRAYTDKKFRRRRTTNPTNVRALRRALRRVEGFVKLEKRVDKIVRRISPRVAHRAARSGFVRSRRK